MDNRLFLALTLVFAFATLVSAQNQTSPPAMPDYKENQKWEKVYSEKVSVVLSGKNADLLQERYESIFQEVTQKAVSVIYDTLENAWLALYVDVTYELETNKSSAKVSLFEMKKNRWVLVEDLSGRNQNEISEFLSRTYDLKPRSE